MDLSARRAAPAPLLVREGAPASAADTDDYTHFLVAVPAVAGDDDVGAQSHLGRRAREVRGRRCHGRASPRVLERQQLLYLRPLPQGHGALTVQSHEPTVAEAARASARASVVLGIFISRAIARAGRPFARIARAHSTSASVMRG